MKASDFSDSAHSLQQVASDILKPTLHDNDFLQSFVRIGLEDNSDSCHSHTTEDKVKRDSKRKFNVDTSTKNLSSKVTVRSISEGKVSKFGIGTSRRNQTIPDMLTEQMQEYKSRKKKRRKSEVLHRQEEIYTDKDRAAAVNMGSKDIKQSLKLKRRMDRSKELQLPDEAEPSAMLALGMREIRCGYVTTAINCINKALELCPNDRNALTARSKCHLLLGDAENALSDAEAALNGKSKEVNISKALFYKAEALYHLGDFELSLVHYCRGMRIRPEFDQFRLGTQKSREAIRNILGDNPQLTSTISDICTNKKYLPKPRYGSRSPKNKFTSEDVNGYFHKLPNIEIKINKNAKLFENRPLTLRRVKQESSLHGQLNIDTRYLQHFLKRSDIKIAYQDSVHHIMVHAEEGIAFLKARQEFWRQQRLTGL